MPIPWPSRAIFAVPALRLSSETKSTISAFEYAKPESITCNAVTSPLAVTTFAVISAFNPIGYNTDKSSVAPITFASAPETSPIITSLGNQVFSNVILFASI